MIEKMGRLRLLAFWIAFSYLCAAQATNPQPVKLSVYISAACGAANTTAKAALQNNASGLCFQKPPILTERDIESAEFHRGSKGQPEVFLSFHNDAAMRELQETKANVGKRVGIVLNGRLTSSPEIPGASRFLFIDAGFTDAQVIELVAAFNRQAIHIPSK